MIIDLHRAAEWLSARGWSPASTDVEWWGWWRDTADGHRYRTILPMPCSDEYDERAEDAVACISIAEGDSPDEVWSAIGRQDSPETAPITPADIARLEGELENERRRASLAETHLSERAERAEAEAEAQSRRASLAELAMWDARADSGRYLLAKDAALERALRAEGEVVGWMGAYNRLADSLR